MPGRRSPPSPEQREGQGHQMQIADLENLGPGTDRRNLTFETLVTDDGLMGLDEANLTRSFRTGHFYFPPRLAQVRRIHTTQRATRRRLMRNLVNMPDLWASCPNGRARVEIFNVGEPGRSFFPQVPGAGCNGSVLCDSLRTSQGNDLTNQRPMPKSNTRRENDLRKVYPRFFLPANSGLLRRVTSFVGRIQQADSEGCMMSWAFSWSRSPVCVYTS